MNGKSKVQLSPFRPPKHRHFGPRHIRGILCSLIVTSILFAALAPLAYSETSSLLVYSLPITSTAGAAYAWGLISYHSESGMKRLEDKFETAVALLRGAPITASDRNRLAEEFTRGELSKLAALGVDEGLEDGVSSGRGELKPERRLTAECQPSLGNCSKGAASASLDGWL